MRYRPIVDTTVEAIQMPVGGSLHIEEGPVVDFAAEDWLIVMANGAVVTLSDDDFSPAYEPVDDE